MLEARPIVGGTAASETFAGATVNICNCDHITFRTTPVIDELDLGSLRAALPRHGRRRRSAWRGRVARSWRQWHDVGRTIDELAATHPGEVDGFRRYLRAARPAVRLILAAATEPPTLRGLTRVAAAPALRRACAPCCAGAAAARPIMRSFFRHDALLGPAMVGGPMVWGVSPELPGTGLGRARRTPCATWPGSAGRSAAAAR